MPIEHQIKSYFQTENILEGTLNYISELEASFDEHGIVTNFVQGQLWQEKKKLFQDKLRIPLFLYYDDYAVNDPLGSHSGNESISAFYYSFPTTRSKNISQIDFIFPAMFVKAKLLKLFNMNNIVYNLVEILKNLETEGYRNYY